MYLLSTLVNLMRPCIIKLLIKIYLTDPKFLTILQCLNWTNSLIWLVT